MHVYPQWKVTQIKSITRIKYISFRQILQIFDMFESTNRKTLIEVHPSTHTVTPTYYNIPNK